MFESLPGFRDFYPDRCAVRNYLFDVWRFGAKRHGFSEYDAPILEPLNLYVEKSGEEITGQLFTFEDRGGRKVALRPEMTPSLARLVGKRGQSLKRPIKWFTVGENFRYEKPQKGRQRSFYQLNADIFGEPGPAADAELIALCIQVLRDLGLTSDDVWLRLSDRFLWVGLLSNYGFDDAQIEQILGIMDKREREPRAATREKLKPYFSDSAEDFIGRAGDLVSARSLEELRSVFTEELAREDSGGIIERRLLEWRDLLETLEAMELLPFIRIDLGVVRGLAYYTGFVFEVFERTGKTRSIAGGGRYDHLVGKLGYMEMPAAGFAMGDVTLVDALEAKNLLPDLAEPPEICILIGGERERKVALGDACRLRNNGFRVEYPFKTRSLGKQLKAAVQSGARLALIYRSDELEEDAVRIRDLQLRAEKLVNRKGLGKVVAEFLKSGMLAG